MTVATSSPPEGRRAPRRTWMRIATVTAVLAIGGIAAIALYTSRSPSGMHNPLVADPHDNLSLRANLDDQKVVVIARPHPLPVRGDPEVVLGSIERLTTFRCSTNSLGLRGGELTPEPAEGMTRVAVVGDSIVFGHGVEDEQTLPAQLEQQLAADGRFEVVNGGMPALDSASTLRLLEGRILPLQPHAVVILVGNNDLVQRFEEPRVLELMTFRLPEWAQRSLLDSFAANLGAMVGACRRAGAAPLLVVPPNGTFYPFPESRLIVDVIERIGRRDGVPVFDASELVRREEAREGLVLEDAKSQQRLVQIEGGRRTVLLTADVQAQRPYFVADEIYAYLEAQKVSQRLLYDGCHPTAEGNAQIAAALAPEVRAVLADPSR